MELSDDEEPAEEENVEPSEKEADEPHADALSASSGAIPNPNMISFYFKPNL